MIKSIISRAFAFVLTVSVSVIGIIPGIGEVVYAQNMLETVEPSAIICLGEPFKEMDGNIIAVDYRASRKVVR